MKTGYVVTCQCGAEIDDFSLADEWFCECGNAGILEVDKPELGADEE